MRILPCLSAIKYLFHPSRHTPLALNFLIRNLAHSPIHHPPRVPLSDRDLEKLPEELSYRSLYSRIAGIMEAAHKRLEPSLTNKELAFVRRMAETDSSPGVRRSIITMRVTDPNILKQMLLIAAKHSPLDTFCSFHKFLLHGKEIASRLDGFNPHKACPTYWLEKYLPLLYNEERALMEAALAEAFSSLETKPYTRKQLEIICDSLFKGQKLEEIQKLLPPSGGAL